MDKKELIKLEAKILVTKHMAEAIDKLIAERQNIKLTRTGHHDIEVEDMATKMLNIKAKALRKNLNQLIKKHGEMPYTMLEQNIIAEFYNKKR